MDSTTSDGTGEALIEHWKRMADMHLVNENTAGALRAACTKVLGALGDDWKATDVRTLDLEDVLHRFQTKHHKDMNPQSLATYKGRFRNALTGYLEYLEDPSGWRPKNSRSARTSSSRVRPETTTPETNMFEVDGSPGMITYPFPLRTGVLVSLALPPDLTEREAKRLNGFIDSLAVEEQPALGPGTPRELTRGSDE